MVVSHKQPTQKVALEGKRPPLDSLKARKSLQSISNNMAPTASFQTRENLYGQTSTIANTKDLTKSRRISMAIRNPTTQISQPKRRVSIAAYQSEPSFKSTPLRTTDSQNSKGGAIGRQSFLKDPRKARYSNLFRAGPEATPTASSSKFMGSPPTQSSFWKSKHPGAVALQRKLVQWSPLKKTLSMKPFRKSFAQPPLGSHLHQEDMKPIMKPFRKSFAVPPQSH